MKIRLGSEAFFLTTKGYLVVKQWLIDNIETAVERFPNYFRYLDCQVGNVRLTVGTDKLAAFDQEVGELIELVQEQFPELIVEIPADAADLFESTVCLQDGRSFIAANIKGVVTRRQVIMDLCRIKTNICSRWSITN